MASEHWVWLGLALSPGGAAIDEILAKYPDPEDFFLAGREGIDSIESLSESDRLRLQGTPLDMAKVAMEKAEGYGALVIPRNDPDYPELLRKVPSAPPVLYVLGDPRCLNSMPSIGVVGTRHVTDYGRKMSEIIAGGLAAAGATVVSGLSKGTDSEILKACIRSGGNCIAVQGCGICNTYPGDCRELKELIAANGAVISEFSPDSEAQGSFQTVKNRIVSGMSLGVCVIEAAAKSGTSRTATLAQSQGRKVFAVPSDVLRSTSPGTFRLLKQGAIPVANAWDILSEYLDEFPEIKNPMTLDSRYMPHRESYPRVKTLSKKNIPEGLSENAVRIFRLCDNNPKFADELSQKAGLTAAEAAAAFTELEMCGLIKPVAGRRFLTA